MANDISLIVMKSGASSGKEISGLVDTIEWSGRRGSPTRTLTVSLLDDDGYGHERSQIDIEDGYQCIFSYKGKELFRGIFLRQTQTHQKTADFKAYDLGVYLSNNKDTFCYENKTATAVFNDVCSRFGIPVGGAAATSYTIPDLTKKKTTGWDAIADALSLDYENTGYKHYVFADKGKLYLRKRTETILQWVLEVDANITNYRYYRSIEDVKTRIKLLSKEGTVLAEETDTALEKLWGVFQDVDTPDESLSTAQIKTLAKTMLAEKKVPERTLTLNNVLGLPDVISGVGVFIKIPHLSLNKTFYVDSDTHTFRGNLHTMALELNLISEVKKDEPVQQEEQQQPKEYKQGDIVYFKGGTHYTSSYAGAKGYPARAGKARIHLDKNCKYNGGVHPWSLIHTDGESNVYGWVDDGTFE